jgi:peptide/nickel transport system substrate-binding protein
MVRFRSTTVGRLMLLALAIGLVMPLAAAAQDSTPSAQPAVVQPKTKLQIQEELKAAFAATDEPAQNTEGTYIVGTTGDLQSTNPFLAESSPSLDIVSVIYEGFFNGDPRTGEPICGFLCESYEIADDGITYTFHIDKNATFTDGVDVTSADVAFSLEALADPATGSAYTGSFNDSVASWNVIDDDTIQIVAKQRLYTFIYDIQTITVIPKHIWESIPRDQWASDPASTGQDPSRIVGTGPFKLDSWTQGQEIRLVRNEDYYDPAGKPNIKEVIYRIFPDSESQFNAFLNGEIDYIERLEPEQYETVANTEGVSVQPFDDRGFTYYEFNLNQDVETRFLDPKVRQAFLWALDRESIVRDIRLGFGEVANGTQPKISPGYAPEEITTTYTYDPERAKALLAEAGWTDTNGDGTVDKDGQEMSFEFLYAAGSATSDSLVAYLQDAWKAVGIDIQPNALEFSALIEATTTNLDWRMALYSFSWDATFIQDAMFGTDQYQVGFNDMKYSNPQLDEIFAQTKREFDPEKRRALLIEAANIVNEEQPIGVLYFVQSIDAWSNRVHNINPGAWTSPLVTQSYVGPWIDA